MGSAASRSNYRHNHLLRILTQNNDLHVSMQTAERKTYVGQHALLRQLAKCLNKLFVIRRPTEFNAAINCLKVRV